MNKLIKSALIFCAVSSSAISTLSAGLLIIVDVSDPTAVVFTATAESPSRDEMSLQSIDGISLMNFISNTSAYGESTVGTLAAVGAPSFDGYVFLDAANTSSPGPGSDLNIFSSSSGFLMFFETAGPSFSGNTTIDFTAASVTLPTAGTVGEIRPGVGSLLTASIGSYQVIPEPSTSFLLLSGVLASLTIRRR